MFGIQLLHTIDTEYSADSIEWCTHPNYKHIFVCGTYQLEEKKDDNVDAPSPCHRKGRIYLYEFDKYNESFKELHRIETAAVLDMKWLKCNDNDLPILASATALGNIEMFVMEGNELKLKQSINLNPDDENLLALSLDWGQVEDSEELAGNRKNSILASDSKGNISLLDWSYERNMEIVRSWHAHNFEAWICAFDKWDQNRVYTGGDDTFLHVYDIRTESRVLVNKSHMAGVTCLLSHPNREHILLTGSYDENLRTFDTRAMKGPLNELNLQGGIWRLKSDPLNHSLILCACMYHNFSIVQLDDLNSTKLVGEFGEHKSICYGADWCMNVDNSGDRFHMATCSFYDHKLCITSVNKQ